MSEEEVAAFAEDVIYQFGYKATKDGVPVVTAGGLSTLEWAFAILGWDDPHPCPESACAEPGCGQWATCGVPTDEGYLRLCGDHARARM